MVASHDDRDRDTRIDAMTNALILVFGDRAIEIAERQAISDIGRTGPSHTWRAIAAKLRER
jgi:hypothetical protein